MGLGGCRARVLAPVPTPAVPASCFSYIHKVLGLISSQEIEKARAVATESLIRRKKLILVLDVDNTLLHSAGLRDLTLDERYLLREAKNTKGGGLADRSLFVLERFNLLVKLRPFVRTFLNKAASMFDMYLYTMGGRDYAHEIAKLLDPDGSYFRSRVISRDDSTSKHVKGLDVVLGDERMVIALDDNKRVWINHRDNQILMLPYNYFASGRSTPSPCKNNKFKSLAELRTDESLEDGSVLQYMLLLLIRAHIKFFPDDDQNAGDHLPVHDRDVRPLLKSMKGKVLKGYTLAFSSALNDQDWTYWKMAESLGATCCMELDSLVTHVVLAAGENHTTKRAQWALANNKLMVPHAWVFGAYHLWYPQPEESFRNMSDLKRWIDESCHEGCLKTDRMQSLHEFKLVTAKWNGSQSN